MLKRKLKMLRQLAAANGSPTDSLIDWDCVLDYKSHLIA